MSDYEDDMDLDDRPVKESITFSSDNTNAKGKRSAANLPVEAEDSLPWYDCLFGDSLIYEMGTDWPRVEKYRPETLDDVSGHQDILATINKFVDSNVERPLKHKTDRS